MKFKFLADSHGNVVTLGERDCSIQRKHQKLIEESPSELLTNEKRIEISELCKKAVSSLGYEGVGTLRIFI